MIKHKTTLPYLRYPGARVSLDDLHADTNNDGYQSYLVGTLSPCSVKYVYQQVLSRRLPEFALPRVLGSSGGIPRVHSHMLHELLIVNHYQV